MSGFHKMSGNVVLCMLLSFVGQSLGQEIQHPGGTNEPFLTCPGSCIEDSELCKGSVVGMVCENGKKCCIEVFHHTTTESNRPLSYEPTSAESNPEAIVEEIKDTHSTQNSEYTSEGFISTDYFTTTSTLDQNTYEQCPGACIPEKYSSLCQYHVRLESLCNSGKICCASKAAVEMEQLQDEIAPEVQESDCPGKCVHPSLTIFCNRILEGYSCPMDSKCCEEKSPTPVSTEDAETVMQCTGGCLSYDNAYLCVPPLELVPGTSECQGTICCMRMDEEFQESADRNTVDVTIEEDSELSTETGDVLASDDDGLVYVVYQNGKFRPLTTITPEESLNPNYVHFSDFDLDVGRVSLYRDASGELFQLSVIQYQPDLQELYPSAVETIQNSVIQDSESIVSVPDDSDDIEENMKDVILPEDGEINTAYTTESQGNTVTKIQCPGSCMSSYLKFTCLGNSAIYEGFSCPSGKVCCASVAAIEEHGAYLRFTYDKTSPLSEQNEGCGIKGQNHKGQYSSPGEWCWQVAIINAQNQYICSGALIDDSWVLTAAHCVTGALHQDQTIYVRAGVADLTDPMENKWGQTLKALSIFVHHNHNSMSLDNNIALLRLQSSFELNANVCAVCLPTQPDFKSLENSECTVTGYGFVTEDGKMPLKLHEASAPIIDEMDCISNLTDALGSVFILPSSSFCAGEKNSCQRDAGGPLVCEKGGRHELAGLVSWGLGCGNQNVPSIFVKVPPFIEWINEIVTASAFLKSLN